MAGRISYYGGIVKDGLVLDLDAGKRESYNRTGTSWNDVSGNQKTGFLTNGPTFNSLNGGSIVFDSVDDYVDLTFSNPFSETILVWAKSATATWDENGWISSSRRENGHIIHPDFSIKQISFYIFNSSASFTLVGTTIPSDITIPHMYVISTNGSNSHKCYIDNTLLNTSTVSITRTNTPSSQVWYIGRDDFGSRYGGGNVYQVLRYNRQLSDSEVLQNYNATKGRYL